MDIQKYEMNVKRIVQQVDDVVRQIMVQHVQHIVHHQYDVDHHVRQGHQLVIMEVGVQLHIHTQVVVDHVIVQQVDDVVDLQNEQHVQHIVHHQ